MAKFLKKLFSICVIVIMTDRQLVMGFVKVDQCDQTGDEGIFQNCAKFCTQEIGVACRSTMDQVSGERFTFCQCENFNENTASKSRCIHANPPAAPNDASKKCESTCPQVTSNIDGVTPLTSFYCPGGDSAAPADSGFCICGRTTVQEKQKGDDGSMDDHEMMMTRRRHNSSPHLGIHSALKQLFGTAATIFEGTLSMIQRPFIAFYEQFPGTSWSKPGGKGGKGKGSKGFLGSDNYIVGPTVTNRGSWGDMEMCKHGKYVYGFKLKVQSYQGENADDNGVTGIMLLCRKSVSLGRPQEIVSTQYGLGDWGRGQSCQNNGKAVGFQLRQQSDQGSKDDMAVVNFRLLCEREDKVEAYNGINDFGDWTPEQRCPHKTYVCGIRTQVEDCGACADNSAVNNVKFLCCP